MGQKGAKKTSKGQEAGERWRARLGVLGGVTSRSMFGGVGLFADGKMFAMVNSKGELAFKGDDKARATFEAAGAVQHGKMPYFKVPKAIEADEKALLEWAREALRAAGDAR